MTALHATEPLKLSSGNVGKGGNLSGSGGQG
jgi:hypothetical protein